MMPRRPRLLDRSLDLFDRPDGYYDDYDAYGNRIMPPMFGPPLPFFGGPVFWILWIEFDPVWAPFMSWMDDRDYEVWHSWQRNIRNKNYSIQERRERLLETIYDLEPLLSRSRRERLADRMIDMEGDLGADEYGHVVTTTTTTTTTVTQQQREQVASQFLQQLNASGSNIGFAQADQIRQAILTGQRDDLVRRQFQSQQSGATQQAPTQLPPPQPQLALPAPQQQLALSVPQQQVALPAPQQQPFALPTAQPQQNIQHQYAPPQNQIGQQVLQTTTTTSTTTTSSSGHHNHQSHVTAPHYQQPVQSYTQPQYQQIVQTPQPAQPIQHQQPPQITVRPSQHNVAPPQYVQQPQRYQQPVQSPQPVQQLQNVQKLPAAAVPNKSMVQYSQQSLQFQQQPRPITTQPTSHALPHSNQQRIPQSQGQHTSQSALVPQMQQLSVSLSNTQPVSQGQRQYAQAPKQPSSQSRVPIIPQGQVQYNAQQPQRIAQTQPQPSTAGYQQAVVPSTGQSAKKERRYKHNKPGA